MKLERLHIENFRGFESLEIAFDPSFTVILGGNMSGKTALLDAAAIALSTLSSTIVAYRDIQPGDVRKVLTEIESVPDLRGPGASVITALATTAGGESLRWFVASPPQPAMYEHSGFVSSIAASEDPIEGLPVLAHYGTARGWDVKLVAPDVRGVGSRTDGYHGWLDARPAHKALLGWMRKQTLVELQRKNYSQPQRAAVEAAVKMCIDGVVRFWYDVQYDELMIERSAGDIQPFSTLSEGYRNTVAMVADIAWRAAVLNPQHGDHAHLLTEGVVLIDELDLHLHPAWQRRIVADLQRTFPKVQFIVTTHSPQIVASVKREQVRVLKDNRLLDMPVFVEGRDTNGILEDVFGVPARPPEAQAKIDEVFRLLDDEKFEAARVKLDELRAHLGPDDSAIIRADWVLDTEAPRPTG